MRRNRTIPIPALMNLRILPANWTVTMRSQTILILTLMNRRIRPAFYTYLDSLMK